MSSSDLKALIKTGEEALGRADWQTAYDAFLRAAQVEESARLQEQLGWSAWWLNKPDACFEALERAYQLYADGGDRSGAARVAIWLARARMEFKAEHAIANGWLQRAHSHLDGLDESPELGWLLLFEGHLALIGKRDTEKSRTLARKAITIGKTFQEVDIEMWGRALDGLSLVVAGDVNAGMQQLDEAAAIGVAGEAKDLNAIAATCCYLIHACERTLDHERAKQWYERTKEICRRWHFSALFAVCRTQYAFIMMCQGLWTEAEMELLSAREELLKYRPSVVPLCDLRLAELRRLQGQFDDATQLFSAMESHPVSVLGRGLIALDQGDVVSALGLAERYLRRVPPTDRIERASGLKLLLRAQIALKRLDEARVTVGEILAIAAAISIDPLKGAASFCSGLLSFASDDLETSRQQFEDAFDYYDRARMPFDAARARLELATVLQELERSDHARTEAQRALDTFQKLGATFEEQRCLAFLQSIVGDTTSAMTESFRKMGFTRREGEILTLIAAGKSNEEIAEQLFLSVRTVERHVSNIYQKMGVSGKTARAAAVAYAAKAGLVG